MSDRHAEPHLKFGEAAGYWTGFVGQHYLRLSAFDRLRTHAETRILRRGLPPRGAVQIPQIDPGRISPQEFRREYVLGYVPVVLKGVAAHWPAVQNWSPEYFKSRYGQEKVCVRVKAAGVGVESLHARDVTLAELVDNICNNGEYYGNNLEDLFNQHQELRRDLMLTELEEYSCAKPPHLALSGRRGWRIPRWGEIFSTQIFLSNANGRTGYHCASGGNFFLQVHGRKKWTFVSPRHSLFMYPAVRKDFLYAASPVDAHLAPDRQLAEGHPLYNLVAKHEVILDPGDVLYSPQWWWHTVDNLSLSIGVAMRFRTGIAAGNPLFSAMTGMSPHLIRHVFQIYRTGWGSDNTAARTIFEPEGSNAAMPVLSSRRALESNAPGESSRKP